MTKYKSAEEVVSGLVELLFVQGLLKPGDTTEVVNNLLSYLRPHLKTGEVIDVEGAAGKIEDKYCSNYVFTDPIHKALRAESIADIIRKHIKYIKPTASPTTDNRIINGQKEEQGGEAAKDKKLKDLSAYQDLISFLIVKLKPGDFAEANRLIRDMEKNAILVDDCPKSNEGE